MLSLCYIASTVLYVIFFDTLGLLCYNNANTKWGSGYV